MARGSTTPSVQWTRVIMELPHGRLLGDGHAVYVIAEIGQNHQGCVQTAKQMISAAKVAGADCAKLQKSCLEAKFTRAALDRQYDGQNSWGKTYGEHKEFLEFSHQQYFELQAHALAEGIDFTASAMDVPSAKFLVEQLKVPFIKVGSSDHSNTPLLQYLAAETDTPLIVSTGMADLYQIKSTYDLLRRLRKGSTAKFGLLQCTSAYPTQPEDVNLAVIDSYRDLFPDAVIGYSGHEIGYVPTLGAVAKGAKIVERHVTFDQDAKGSDHECSLSFQQLQEMVSCIRIMESCLGSPTKRKLGCEAACFSKLGKSLVAAKSLAAGTKLAPADIEVKVSSPFGAESQLFSSFVGRTLSRSVGKDEPITAEIAIAEDGRREEQQ